jgi:hypothetical protein
MNTPIFLIISIFALLATINCMDTAARFCENHSSNELMHLLATPGISVEMVIQCLEKIGGLSSFDSLIGLDNPEIAEAILSYGVRISPDSRISSIDTALRALSTTVATYSIGGFTEGSPEHDLADLYISEIKSTVDSHCCWPTTRSSSMYELIRNGHTNIIQMLVESGFPVNKLEQCSDLAMANEATLKILQPCGLDMSKCGQQVIEVLSFSSFTPGKLQAMFDAGLPKDHQDYGRNWLEQTLVRGRYELAACAYGNGIQLSLARLKRNYYHIFQISPLEFIDHIVKPQVKRTIQSLSIVLRHKNGPFIELAKETQNHV